MCKEYLGGADLDPEYDNTAKLPIFFSHTPNGASIRQFQHFDQKFYEPKNDPSSGCSISGITVISESTVRTRH